MTTTIDWIQEARKLGIDPAWCDDLDDLRARVLAATAKLMPTEHEWPTDEDRHTTWLADVAEAVCPECGSRVGECMFLCSRSPLYYSLEQECRDDEANDVLSHDEWFVLAVRQYEGVHGAGSYCS